MEIKCKAGFQEILRQMGCIVAFTLHVSELPLNDKLLKANPQFSFT
jgi:hypothetical protein